MALRSRLLTLLLSPMLLASATEAVPIFEREPPIDPEEQRKYYEIMGQAVLATEQVINATWDKDFEAER